MIASRILSYQLSRASQNVHFQTLAPRTLGQVAGLHFGHRSAASIAGLYRLIHSSAAQRAELADAPPKKPRKTRSDAGKPKVKKDGSTAPPKKSKAKKAASPAPDVKAPPARARTTVKLPKQINSAWQLYFGKQEYKQQHPDEKISVTQLATKFGQEYHNLSASERSALDAELETVKAQYKEDYATALAALTPQQFDTENKVRAARRKDGRSTKSNLIDPAKPKRPASSYVLFFQERANDSAWVEEALSDLTSSAPQTERLPTLSRAAAAEWRSMTEDQRAPYKEKADDSLAEWTRAIESYKDKA